MALSATPFLGTNATVAAAGTSVAPAVAVPDNCSAMVVYNESSTNTIYIAADGTAAPAAIAAASAVFVPPEASLTLTFGTLNQRAGSMASLRFDCSAGAATARITYVNELGG